MLNEFCLDEETGVYFDYDFQNKARTNIYCVACYLPFVFGINGNKEALNRINERLILAHGVSSCEKLSVKGVYQWGYPNAWAPHQFWAFKANENCDNRPIARLIAEKYLDNVASTYDKKGVLFEKYDGHLGGEATVNEYKVPEMLGWTAGVYNYFYSKINE